MEQRVRQLEHFIKKSTALSPIDQEVFTAILNDIEDPETSQDLDTYLSQHVTILVRDEKVESECRDSLIPSPSSSAVNILSPGSDILIEPTGLVSVNENSVISHVGVTSGIHLVTQCERIDNEIWYRSYGRRN